MLAAGRGRQASGPPSPRLAPPPRLRCIVRLRLYSGSRARRAGGWRASMRAGAGAPTARRPAPLTDPARPHLGDTQRRLTRPGEWRVHPVLVAGVNAAFGVRAASQRERGQRQAEARVEHGEWWWARGGRRATPCGSRAGSGGRGQGRAQAAAQSACCRQNRPAAASESRQDQPAGRAPRRFARRRSAAAPRGRARPHSERRSALQPGQRKVWRRAGRCAALRNRSSAAVKVQGPRAAPRAPPRGRLECRAHSPAAGAARTTPPHPPARGPE